MQRYRGNGSTYTAIDEDSNSPTSKYHCKSPCLLTSLYLRCLLCCGGAWPPHYIEKDDGAWVALLERCWPGGQKCSSQARGPVGLPWPSRQTPSSGLLPNAPPHTFGNRGGGGGDANKNRGGGAVCGRRKRRFGFTDFAFLMGTAMGAAAHGAMGHAFETTLDRALG